MKDYNSNITKTIDVLILIGGLGTRLRSISKGIPKPLVEVNNQPFLSIVLDYISSFGFRRIILCACYKPNLIKSYVKNNSFNDMEIVLSIEEKALGTAGAVKNAQKYIHSDNFLVLNGDTFLGLNYFEFIKFYFYRNASALISLSESRELKKYGNIEIDENQRILKFKEKNMSNHASRFFNSGVYIFNKIILEHIPINCKVSLEYDTFPLIIKKTGWEILGFVSKSKFIDIGTPKDYNKAKIILFNTKS